MLGRVGEGGSWDGVEEGGSWGGVGEGDSWGGVGVSLTLAETRVGKNPVSRKPVISKGWAKVKVVADVIFYTLFFLLLLCRERDLPIAQ